MKVDFQRIIYKLIFSLILVLSIVIKSYSQISTSINKLPLTKVQIENIISAIEPYNYVSIGEASHGDGTSQLMTAQIIENLISKLNFDVIIFESDFYSLLKAEQEFGKSMAYDSAIIFNNLYYLFTNNLDTKDFIFKYLPSKVHDKTISLGGFDIWPHTNYPKNKMPFELDSLIKRSNIRFSDSNEYYDFFIPYLENSVKYMWQNSVETNSRFLSDLNIVLKQLESIKYFPLEYIITLENLKVCIECVFNKEFIPGKNTTPERENQMARISKYLIEDKYKNKKIIFWGHAGHLTKNYLGENPPMLSILVENSIPKIDVYSIVFISYKGTEFNHNIWNFESFKAPRTSFEYELYKLKPLGTKLIFPKGEMLKNTYYCGHHFPLKMNLTNYFNLLIFIPEMKPINVRLK